MNPEGSGALALRPMRTGPLPTRPLGTIVSGHMISRRGFVAGSVTLLAAPLAAAAQLEARLSLPALSRGSVRATRCRQDSVTPLCNNERPSIRMVRGYLPVWEKNFTTSRRFSLTGECRLSEKCR